MSTPTRSNSLANLWSKQKGTSQTPSTSDFIPPTEETPDSPTNSTTEVNKEEEVKPFSIKTQSYLRVLIKITRQITKSRHHINLLTVAIEENRPPRGLTPRINPRLPDSPIDFILDWEENLQLTAIILTKKLLSYWTKRLTTLEYEKTKLETIIQTDSTTAQCRKIQEILEQVTRDVETDLNRKKTQRPKLQARRRIERTDVSTEKNQQ
jgi:hypothetical protein